MASDRALIRTISSSETRDAEDLLSTGLRSLGFALNSQDESACGVTVVLCAGADESAVEQIVTASAHGRVLVVDCTPTNSRADHWRLLASGASDVIVYSDPVTIAPCIASRVTRWNEVDEIVSSPEVNALVMGSSPAWKQLLRGIVEIAAFTISPVLIMGESGTGKELIARLIHLLDRRPGKSELVLLDCSTIVPELAGSEFYGHEKGAYTGASGARDGAFALADRGTLFLDEAGELPLALQAQLLRAVQEKTYKRLGSNVWRETDFRLICATNRDLEGEIAKGTFRRDLYYRIASWICRLPPLRERPEDILPLARHFLSQTGSPAPDFDPAVADYLLARDYPGNVRDLRQIVTRMAHRHTGLGPITAGDVAPEDRPIDGHTLDWRDAPFRRSVRRALSLGAGLKEIGRAAENMAEEAAIEEEGGNLQRAAARLGITDRALQLRRQARKQAAAG